MRHNIVVIELNNLLLKREIHLNIIFLIKKGKIMVKKRNRRQVLKGHTYTRSWMIQEIAKRLGFTSGDVSDIFDEFENILKEIVGEKETLVFSRIFTMYLSKQKARRGFNVSKGMPEDYPETYYVSFKASKSLLSELPEMKDKNLVDED